ncbi:poly(R)-hydroxyalkanoic acid synthase subunit PhaE [uncultured Sphingomonas sp.]|uniref:poly(R)-hydroxyalkanoic acid synthase subunit PhaE n=1 Tax=uncultured Sphingomonas sp. TaxID=158754 RepID=UPI0035CC9DAE
MSTTPPDPAALFRTMIGEWEKLTNSVGGQSFRTDEMAHLIGGASNASAQAQAAFHGLMERALAAANMPSRGEVEDLSARLARIEGALFRMEAKIDALGRSAPDKPVSTGPTRGRKPPVPAEG